MDLLEFLTSNKKGPFIKGALILNKIKFNLNYQANLKLIS
mgnify:CR=1 FL=1